jgi:transcriptional accessory protein Tex/SPT6
MEKVLTFFVVKTNTYQMCAVCVAFVFLYISVQPLLVRQVRSELTHKAERAAVEVFATNLKKLLLLPPIRGKTVLGIDPGKVYFLRMLFIH